MVLVEAITVPGKCSSDADCDLLCGGSGDCKKGKCTCVDGKTKAVDVDALRNLD